MTSLTTSYSVQKVTDNRRVEIMQGLPTVPSVGPVDSTDTTLATGQTYTADATNYLALELVRPLEVTLIFRDSGGSETARVVRDLCGLLIFPTQMSIIISNPARFRYPLAVPIRLVRA